jgi:transcriptional regulator with XRE-family HTH domain
MPGPPTVRLRRLASELRRLRAGAELTREDVADRTGIDRATLYRIETARARPQARTLRALLELYGADEAKRDELLDLARGAARRGWLSPYDLPAQYTMYIGFEAEAASLLNFECSHVPGLLQTEDYARAAIRRGMPDGSREDIENRIRARIGRQELLHGNSPLKLWAIADEAVLRRLVGGRAVMRAQLDHIAEMADLPNVTFQVIPFSAGAHPGMSGEFVILRFEEPVGADVVYIESMAGDLFLEEPGEIGRYATTFEHLRALALPPDASVALVREVAGEEE